MKHMHSLLPEQLLGSIYVPRGRCAAAAAPSWHTHAAEYDVHVPELMRQHMCLSLIMWYMILLPPDVFAPLTRCTTLASGAGSTG